MGLNSSQLLRGIRSPDLVKSCASWNRHKISLPVVDILIRETNFSSWFESQHEWKLDISCCSTIHSILTPVRKTNLLNIVGGLGELESNRQELQTSSSNVCCEIILEEVP